jgi:hypothetical protein
VSPPAGGEVLLGGVLPTPAAPLLIGRYGLDLAAVLSASHNPYRDNGIKFFGADGHKLSDATELDIERRLERTDRPVPPVIGRIRALHGTQEDYLRALHERFAASTCAAARRPRLRHGATHRVAPRSSAASAPRSRDRRRPDGRNINAGLRLEARRPAGDRGRDGGLRPRASPSTATATACLAVDRTGAVVDGDELIALARCTCAGRRLAGDGVAVTVMTNYGFHAAMEAAGIEVATTKVGDRYVLEELRGAWLGARRRAVRATSSSSASRRPATGSRARCSRLEALAGRDPRAAQRDAQACPAPRQTCACPTATRRSATPTCRPSAQEVRRALPVGAASRPPERHQSRFVA